MFELRKYQTEAVEASLSFLAGKKASHGVVVLPTGSGKSLVIAKVVTQLPGPALVFQPSLEILEQNAEKLRACGYEPAIYSAGAGARDVGTITLATIGSVRKSPELFQHIEFVLMDECHGFNPKGGMLLEFLSRLQPGVRVLGFTATPFRLHTNSLGSELRFITRTRPRLFKEVVYVSQVADLAADGHLSPLEYKIVRTGFDRSKLRDNSTGADYTDRSVRRHFSELGFDEQLAAVVKRLNERGRTGSIIFTRFIEEAKHLASRVAGVKVVTGATPPKERRALLTAFKAGEVPHVANVGVLTTGFDYPELATVVLARPTKSLGLYYQMVGRCVRPHESKSVAWVVDMVGLSKQFGAVEELQVRKDERRRWCVASGSRQLTNVYMQRRAA